MVWEERWHPLREEWVIVAAHRQNRPWSGETLEHDNEARPEYLPDCYLCPGNVRVGGKRNDNYTRTFVFDNDHPSVGPEAPENLPPPAGIFRNRPARGIARVVCYSPNHSLALAELQPCEIEELLKVWQQQYLELGSREEIKHVLIFENKGEVVGVSNPHPHCQIYATNFVFKTIETEATVSERHLRETGRILFQDVLRAEREDGRRIICESDKTIAFLPYFA
ncbi:MAG TPA: galactose-1-phosphate uridylyltransferase, partial [Pyrinomonadaceae bacterium]|nr:galactose-1-phosphate uridylyltransferase [Pyrinomonadaceae bacterium]